MRQAPQLLDYFKIHFIVILYAFTAILGNATEANALTIVFFRCVIAAAGLGLMLAASKKVLSGPRFGCKDLVVEWCVCGTSLVVVFRGCQSLYGRHVPRWSFYSDFLDLHFRAYREEKTDCED